MDHIEGPYRLFSDKIVHISILIFWPTLVNISILIYRPTLDTAIAVSVALASSWELLEHFRTILGAFKSILGALQSRLRAYRILPFGAYRIACEIGRFDVLQVLLNLQYQLQILIDRGDIFDLEQP